MDVARLRMQYLLPDGIYIIKIDTALINNSPYDGSNISMQYEAIIRSEYPKDKTGEYLRGDDEMLLDSKVFKCLKGESLQEIVEQCRLWSILYRNEQSTVNKSGSQVQQKENP